MDAVCLDVKESQNSLTFLCILFFETTSEYKSTPKWKKPFWYFDNSAVLILCPQLAFQNLQQTLSDDLTIQISIVTQISYIF